MSIISFPLAMVCLKRSIANEIKWNLLWTASHQKQKKPKQKTFSPSFWLLLPALNTAMMPGALVATLWSCGDQPTFQTFPANSDQQRRNRKEPEFWVRAAEHIPVHSRTSVACLSLNKKPYTVPWNSHSVYTQYSPLPPSFNESPLLLQ